MTLKLTGYGKGKGTLTRELERTAEMLVALAEDQGVYFAVALLFDSSYDTDRIRLLLPILQQQAGAIKKIIKTSGEASCSPY